MLGFGRLQILFAWLAFDGVSASAFSVCVRACVSNQVRILPSNGATGHVLQLQLDALWERPDSSQLVVYRVLLSADAIISRVRRESNMLQRVREGQLQVGWLVACLCVADKTSQHSHRGILCAACLGLVVSRLVARLHTP